MGVHLRADSFTLISRCKAHRSLFEAFAPLSWLEIKLGD
jgi:hypothetical protein